MLHHRPLALDSRDRAESIVKTRGVTDLTSWSANADTRLLDTFCNIVHVQIMT